MKNVQLVAHRGYSELYPENTLIALEQAIISGAKFIEFDVQFSKDRIPVIIHDDNLKRTSGIDKSIFDLSAKELQTIHVGEPQRFANKFTDIKIPLLQEIVDLLNQHPEITAFVEIKRASLRQFPAHEVIKTILDTLNTIKNQCVIISFDLEALRITRQLNDIKIGWVFEPWDQSHEHTARNLSPDYLFTDYQTMPKSISSFWKGPWKWAVYEINNTKTINEYSNLGVDLIETDRIGKLLKTTQNEQS